MNKPTPHPPQDDKSAGPRAIVEVPANPRPLAPVEAQRIERFRAHLRGVLATELRREPPRRQLERTVVGGDDDSVELACGACRGYCCLNAGDHAYIDAGAIRQLRARAPEADAADLTAMYVSRVPALAFEDSCLFHGCGGCTLSPVMRSNLCNSYVCDGLSRLRARRRSGEPVHAVEAKHEGEVVARVTL